MAVTSCASDLGYDTEASPGLLSRPLPRSHLQEPQGSSTSSSSDDHSSCVIGATATDSSPDESSEVSPVWRFHWPARVVAVTVRSASYAWRVTAVWGVWYLIRLWLCRGCRNLFGGQVRLDQCERVFTTDVHVSLDRKSTSFFFDQAIPNGTGQPEQGQRHSLPLTRRVLWFCSPGVLSLL